MGRSASANLTATARVNDQASSEFKKIGKEVKELGHGFEKSAKVIELFGTSAGEMGGEVAQAASKVTGLASIIATGGAFGVASAAAQLLITGISAAYKAMRIESDLAARGQEFAVKNMERARDAAVEHAKEIDKLRDAIRNFGKTEEQVSRDGIEREIARREFGVKILQTEIAGRKDHVEAMQAEIAQLSVMKGGEIASGEAGVRKIHQLEAQIAEERGLLRIQEGGLPITAQRLADLRTELQLTGQLEAKKTGKKHKEDDTKFEESRAKAIASLEAKIAKGSAEIANGNSERLIDLDHKEAKSAEEKERKKAEYAKKSASEREDYESHIASVLERNFQFVADQIIDTEKTAKEKFANIGKYILQQVIGAIVAKAAEAAAGAIANAFDEFPYPANIAVAGVAGAAALAAVLALRAKAGGAAAGGVVTDGSGPVADDVNMNVSRDELIIPAHVHRALRSVMSRKAGSRGGAATGGVVSSGGAGARTHGNNGTSLHVHVQQMVPDSSAGVRSGVRAMGPALAELRRRRMIA